MIYLVLDLTCHIFDFAIKALKFFPLDLMKMSSSKAISNSTPSGIVTTDNNERVIPATRRADGTVRKERRVRPGFVPQEDIARYKNPWVEETTPPPPPKPVLPKTKAQIKNEKRKLKKKEERKKENNLNNLESINNENKQVVVEDSLSQLQSKISEMSVNESNESPTASITIEQLENTTKKIKVLEKKIRQMERIKEKQVRGETLLLEEEEKLSKLEHAQEELRRLKQGNEE
jgi:partner of Y14 and mago protein